MFLSTENPPRHPLSSSSSNLLRLTTCSDDLGQSHLSNFSIRDYAYSNRKNNIKNSWPFSTKSLKLCSSHGVTDPLPPFQKFCSSSGKQIVSHVHHQTIAETSKGVSSQSRIIENGLFTSKSVSKSKVEILVVAATSNNNNNKSKKCGRGGGMVKSKEDSCVVTTASESVMASKTCPICKTFSSASNTTLNAHIDQCLSVDSAVPPVSSKPNKPRVDDSEVPLVSSKPRKCRVKPQVKVKTLVEIYATAKECTLEDLDKRNGTQWATVLSCKNRVAADKSEESKKRKVSPVGVGPVYIDAKGKKLRILTEFSEKKTSTTTSTPLREQQQEDGSSAKRSVSQGSKENSKSLRKRGPGKKHGKYIKLTSHNANASEKEYQQKGHRRIYNNQWMLAKRGLSSKKLNALRDQPSEDDDDDDEWSGEDRLVLRGADLSATVSSPLNKQKLRSQVSGRNKIMFESKRAHSHSSRVQMSDKEERSLAGTCLNTVHSKKSFASIQEDKYPPEKNTDASPRATSMRNLSPPFVSNGWKRLSPPVELKRARLDLSDEEEAGKWESEMTHERELSDDDYVSGDNGVVNEEVLRRSSPSFSTYYDYDDDDDDDDEETSEEEEEEDDTIRANVLDTPPSNEIIPSDERAMYYSEEVRSMIYGQTACEEDVRFGSEVRGKENLYVEVDTIPIPGPPGSFLPSPRGMGFDDHLGNSSVITSQFQSSMDHLDRNSSESPVSNFAAGRLNFQAELPSSSYSTTPMSFCVPSHHGTIIAEAELMTVDKTNNDHESCCCQRKERISLNHQESHLLQRRVAMNLTKSPIRLDPNHPFEQSPCMIQQEFDLHSKLSNRAVVPPSPSNSVLRLMGKDLMVMNQREADNNKEASRISLTPTPQFHDPCAGTGLNFNTGRLYLRNSFESSHQQKEQTPYAQQQAQASLFRNNFDHVRYFPPS